MTRGIEALELHAAPDPYGVPMDESLIETRNPSTRLGMRQNSCARHRPEPLVAANMIAVLVGIEDLRDGPTAGSCGRGTQLPVEGVYGERLPGLSASDEIVVVPPRIRRP